MSLEQCSLDEVALPSPDWQWVGSWKFVADDTTDPEGWIYAFSWEQLDCPRDGGRAVRSWSDVVRRRCWICERMMISAQHVSASINKILADNHKIASLEVINKKLTDQLLKQQDVIADYESKLMAYETTAVRDEHKTCDGAAKVDISRKWRDEYEVLQILHDEAKSKDSLSDSDIYNAE